MKSERWLRKRSLRITKTAPKLFAEFGVVQQFGDVRESVEVLLEMTWEEDYHQENQGASPPGLVRKEFEPRYLSCYDLLIVVLLHLWGVVGDGFFGRLRLEPG